MSRRLLAAALLFLGQGSLHTLAAQTPDSTRKCGPATEPRQLPAVDALIDSALAARVFVVADSFPVTDVVLSLQVDRAGGVALIGVVERNRGLDTAQAVARGVAQTVRPQRAGSLWGVRLRVHLPGAAFTVERSLYCRAELIPQPTSAPKPPPGMPLRPGDRGTLEGTVTVITTVDQEGLASHVEVQGSAGSPAVEESIRQSFLLRRYKPALLDGFPVESTDRESITIRSMVRVIR